MKVKDLIKRLQTLNQDAQVILQKDGEGNGYSPCAGAEGAIYIHDSSYSGEVYHADGSADDNCMEEDHWVNIKKNKKNQCVVLWPVN